MNEMVFGLKSLFTRMMAFASEDQFVLIINELPNLDKPEQKRNRRLITRMTLIFSVSLFV